jgi:cytochrome c oxidase cbb3-type subunit I/II
MQLCDIGVPYTEVKLQVVYDLRKQAVAIEENLKNDPDFVKVITKARKKPKPEERNLFQ